MIYYDSKVKNTDINSLKAVLYIEWCDAQLSESCSRDLKYMDVVHKSYDWLQTISEWSGETSLRKINRYLSMIQPFTDYEIKLFPVVGESR